MGSRIEKAPNTSMQRTAGRRRALDAKETA